MLLSELSGLLTRGMLLIPGTGNGERVSGNKCTAVTRLIIYSVTNSKGQPKVFQPITRRTKHKREVKSDWKSMRKAM